MRSGRLVAISGVISALVGTSAVLTGCGGGGSASGTASTTVAVTDPAPPPTLSRSGPSIGTLRVTAGPSKSLTFAPATLTAHTGIYRFVVDVATSGHAVAFLDPDVRFQPITLDEAGAQPSGRAFFPKAGDYTFACLIPGHRGMSGVVHVTGPARTLHQALVDATASSHSRTSAP
jgi:uncharacterized cupredoxin-like copper-binding protein